MARKTFRYRNVLSFFVYFTMLFNGGLVPQYIMWTTIFHIKDTYAALVLPNLLMTAFNIFLVRNYFTNSLPDALYEAAQLDGASELGILQELYFRLPHRLLRPSDCFPDWRIGTVGRMHYIMFKIRSILEFRIFLCGL